MIGPPQLTTKIAIIKLSSLGDVIHALPVARALRRALRGVHLTWIVEAREYALLKEHPDLDVVVPVDTRLWRRLIWRPAGARQVLGKVRRLRHRIRAARFDVALDLQGLIKSGLLTAYTGAPVRIGFSADHCREGLNCLFTNRRVRPPASAVHVVDQYLALLAPLGIAPGPVEFHVPIPAAAERHMDEFLGEQGVKSRDLIVAINPGAGRDNKRWPVEHFRRLADRLGQEPNVRILLLWGPDEVHMARQIRDGLQARAIMAPPTDLHELAGLLRRSALMVANDTGPLHLAAALGTPSLGLFGPTRAERNGPYGPHCRGVQSPDGTMARLDPQAAVDAALALLARRGPEP